MTSVISLTLLGLVRRMQLYHLELQYQPSILSKGLSSVIKQGRLSGGPLRYTPFLSTGYGRRPCLPRSYIKGNHDFLDVIIPSSSVRPGSLAVSLGQGVIYGYRYGKYSYPYTKPVYLKVSIITISSPHSSIKRSNITKFHCPLGVNRPQFCRRKYQFSILYRRHSLPTLLSISHSAFKK